MIATTCKIQKIGIFNNCEETGKIGYIKIVNGIHSEIKYNRQNLCKVVNNLVLVKVINVIELQTMK